MMNDEVSDLRDRTKSFALRVIKMFSALPKAEEAKVLGKQVVRCTDRSGFVVNFLLVPYLLSAIRMVESGVASIEDVDKAVVRASPDHVDILLPRSDREDHAIHFGTVHVARDRPA